MPSVLLLVEPIEETRQVNADNGEFLLATLEEVCRSVSRTRLAPVTAHRVRASDVDRSLRTLDSGICAVVIASNALRHPDGTVARAYQRHGDAVRRYVEGGGSLVLLHQFVLGDLGGHLGPYQPVLRERDGRACGALVAATTSISTTPHVLGTEVESSATPGSQLRDHVYWRALDLASMPNFEPALVTGSGDTVVARTRPDMAGTVIASTIPVDWHRASRTTENLLHHALVPRPRVAVWGDRPTPDEAAAIRAVGDQHGAVVLPAGTRGHRPDAPRSTQLHYLTAHALAADPGLADDVLAGSRGAVVHAVGTTTDGTGDRYLVEVSRVDRRALDDVVAAVAEQADGYRTVDLYPRRNLLELALRATRLPGSHLDPAMTHALHGVMTRLSVLPVEFPDMTVSTALASVQLSALGLGPARASAHARELVARYAALDPVQQDKGCLAAALLCTAITPDATLRAVSTVTEIVGSMNVVELARTAEWLHVSHHRSRLDRCDPDAITRLGDALVHGLRSRQALDELSPEALANTTLGLGALVDAADHPGARALLLDCVSRLREHLDGDELSDNLPIRARVTTALITCSHLAPSSLANLTGALGQVDRGPATSADATVARLTRLAEDHRATIDELRTQLAGRRSAAVVGMTLVSLAVLGLALGLLTGAARLLADHESLVQFGLVVLVVVVVATAASLRWLARRGLAFRSFATLADRVARAFDRVR